MDTIKVRMEVDREMAIRAGFNRAGTVDVPLPDDLTAEQREIVLSLPVDYNGIFDLTTLPWIDGKRYDSVNVPFVLPPVPDSTATSLKVQLDAYPAAVARYRQALADQVSTYATVVLKEMRFAQFADRIDTLKAFLSPDKAAELERLRERLEAKRRAERERAERIEQEQRERKAAAERERAQVKQAEQAKQAEWIEQHGSPRLRRLLKEGIECGAVYRDERRALERPDWLDWREDGYDCKSPRNPPQGAIDLLDRARVTDPGCGLWYYTREAVEDDGYGPVELDREYGYLVLGEFMGRDVVYKDRFVVGEDD